MVKSVKHKIDEILDNNRYSISPKDYERLKAYIGLLYNYAIKKKEDD